MKGKIMDHKVLSNLVIKKVCSVSTLYSPEKKRARRESRPRWAIIIKYEGETVYTAGQKRYLSDNNHIVVLPMGCSYDWECTVSGHFCTLEFESDLAHPEPISVAVKNGEKILEMLKALERKLSLKKQMPTIEVVRDAYSILLALLQSAGGPYLPTEKHKKIAPALEYLSEHIGEKITNEGLAAVSGLSVVYFRKLFTEIMGVSPIVYLKELRIKKAKEMLRSDYANLSDIALSLGYSSLYDFSRDFKKHTGIAPSKF